MQNFQSEHVYSGSTLLSPEEKNVIRRVLGQHADIFAATIARLYVAHPIPAQWNYTGIQGATILLRDRQKQGAFFFKLVDMNQEKVTWEQELYLELQYRQERPYFHTFSTDYCVAALSFASEEEAIGFFHKVSHRDTLVKKSHARREKKSGKKGFEKLTVHDISEPTNFRHIQHLGYSKEKGFDITNLSPEWKSLLEQAGISTSQLQDRTTAKIVRNFVRDHGGPNAKPSSVPIPPPPRRNAPPPPPLPSSLSSSSRVTSTVKSTEIASFTSSASRREPLSSQTLIKSPQKPIPPPLPPTTRSVGAPAQSVPPPPPSSTLPQSTGSPSRVLPIKIPSPSPPPPPPPPLPSSQQDTPISRSSHLPSDSMPIKASSFATSDSGKPISSIPPPPPPPPSSITLTDQQRSRSPVSSTSHQLSVETNVSSPEPLSSMASKNRPPDLGGRSELLISIQQASIHSLRRVSDDSVKPASSLASTTPQEETGDIASALAKALSERSKVLQQSDSEEDDRWNGEDRSDDDDNDW